MGRFVGKFAIEVYALNRATERHLDGPAPRVNVEIPVGLVAVESSDQTSSGVAMNLSQSGVLVRATDPFAPGTFVRLDFGDFDAVAEVTWGRDGCEGRLMGMRFASLDWRAEEAIRAFVESTASKP